VCTKLDIYIFISALLPERLNSDDQQLHQY
jgi:hypothetical protein